MIEIIVVIIVAVWFSKAAQNRSGSLIWALLGIVYYAIGRILFSVLLYGSYYFFSNEAADFRIAMGLRIIELFIGMLFATVTAFILGEITGLNLRKVFRN